MQAGTVGLFVTCLVDLFRPQVAFACIKLLKEAHCRVIVPKNQTCCGQPSYNNGDLKDTIAIAKQVIDAFKNFTYVVVPSGSCGSMIKTHYPKVLADEPIYAKGATELADRTFELTTFLQDILKIDTLNAHFPHAVTYHDACAGLRELNLVEQPRKLLAQVSELTLKELPDSPICCGFGGTFCVKFPDISNKMVADKAANVALTGAEALLAGDLGCLMNIIGKLQREGTAIKAYHIAEVLANMGHEPAIGEPQ